jgi:hypothetical protein
MVKYNKKDNNNNNLNLNRVIEYCLQYIEIKQPQLGILFLCK